MRHVRSSLLAGLVFCIFAPTVVHFVLPEDTVAEFTAVMRRMEGRAPAVVDEAANWRHVAMVFALRLGFGFVAMALFAGLRRRMAFARAVCGTAFVVFALTYVPLLAWFHFGHGLPLSCVMIGAGIGIAEALLATLLGGLVAGPHRPAR